MIERVTVSESFLHRQTAFYTREHPDYTAYAFGSNLVFTADMHQEARYLREDGAGLAAFAIAKYEEMKGRQRRFWEPDSVQNRFVTVGECRKALRRLSGVDSLRMSGALENARPPEEIGVKRGARPWLRWLVSSHTPQDVFLEVLGWNMEQMIRDNHKRADALEEQKQTLWNGIMHRVYDGSFSETFGEKTVQTLPRARAIIADPLHLPVFRRGGQVYRGDNVVLLTPNHGENVQHHEMVHLLGGFSTKVLDEMATSVIASEITPQEIGTEITGANGWQRQAFYFVMQRAGLDMDQLTRCFAGPHPIQNEEELRRLVREQSKEDLIGQLTRQYGRWVRYYNRRSSSRPGNDLVTAFASLEVLKEFLPYHANEAEIVSRGMPSAKWNRIDELASSWQRAKKRR